MFNELTLDACGSGVRSKLALPLRVELWNGQHVDFSSAPARATIRIANPKALGYLLRPSLDSLGRAYVEGGSACSRWSAPRPAMSHRRSRGRGASCIPRVHPARGDITAPESAARLMLINTEVDHA